jgi:hypothetical protein
MGDDGPQGHSVGFVKLRGGVEVACSASPAALQKAAMNMAAMRSSSHADASNGHQPAQQGGSGDAMPSSLPRRLGQGFKRPRQQPPPQQNVTVCTLPEDYGSFAGPAALTTLGNDSGPGTAHGMVQDVVPLAEQRESSIFLPSIKAALHLQCTSPTHPPISISVTHATKRKLSITDYWPHKNSPRIPSPTPARAQTTIRQTPCARM